ncbi:TIR domain-containing protein [Chlorobaculum sp. 24CR]|uniref:SUMF1/EgtB/PvdO family nonheme iron enzyme n=1 Tax=Chlorobaculum sp. 24CR TaxID=2508878 RepID=UPI00100BF8CE|nr:SUMF1/EgtB/PvdO family nonheme iron enzyme [Chlorobaculum sp. 24CR]RXK85137.1 TIR domain-containing protein [Chlorobaculum sp. 24CR]
MSDIFLSYSQKDEERVRPIVRHLESLGWTVFWDRNIPPGRTWDEYIEMHLDAARCVVVVWSKDSVRSHWVKTEAEEGRRKQILVPLKLDEVTLGLAFRHIQAADLTGWNNDASHGQFKACIEAISALVPQPYLAKKPSSPEISVTSVAPQVPKPQLPEHFVLIKGGQFMMGSPKSEEDRSDDETQHNVKLSDFAMCRYAVTQEEWQKVTGSNPSSFKGDNLPVEQVSWDDCQAFIKKLNEKTGGGNYRLPTEAEWEYACRAGTTTPFNTGENLTTDQANYDGNYPYGKNPKGEYREKTVPVDSFQPNGFRLYNMHGNVWEWCSDRYDEAYYEECRKQGVVENPRGPETGSNRVLRGGSWYNYAGYCRSADRAGGYPGFRCYNVGFRLVFVPQFSAAHPAKEE